MDVVLGGGEGGFGVGSAVADAGDGGTVLLVEARIARGFYGSRQALILDCHEPGDEGDGYRRNAY